MLVIREDVHRSSTTALREHSGAGDCKSFFIKSNSLLIAVAIFFMSHSEV